MKNPYKRTDHRRAFDQAVELYQSGVTDYLAISRQLDNSIPREMRHKVAAKVARLLGGHKPSRSGTAPNVSMVLSAEELEFIQERYDGRKSEALHAGLKLLKEQAANEAAERELRQ